MASYKYLLVCLVKFSLMQMSLHLGLRLHFFDQKLRFYFEKCLQLFVLCSLALKKYFERLSCDFWEIVTAWDWFLIGYLLRNVNLIDFTVLSCFFCGQLKF